jgi:hypothetical protein
MPVQERVTLVNGTTLRVVDAVSLPPADAAAPTLGTGALAFTPTFLAGARGLDTSRSVVTVPTQSSGTPHHHAAAAALSSQQRAQQQQQQPIGLSIEAFHCLGFRFAPPPPDSKPALAALAPPATVHAWRAAELDTSTGRLTASYDVTLAADGSSVCSVEHTVTPLRHAPAFVLHRLDVTVDASVQAGFRVYHDVRADGALIDVRFAGQTLHVPAPLTGNQAAWASAAGTAHYTLQGSATHARSGRAAHVASAYVLDPAEATVLGYNVIQRVAQPDAAYTRVDLRLVTTSMSGGSHTYTLHVLTGMAADAATPEGLQRALLAFFSRGLVPASLTAASDAAWAGAWHTDVQIDAKAGLTPGGPEILRVQRVQRALRAAMFNVLSAASERGAAALADAWASARKVGVTDAFIVPLLVLLLPDVAEAALNMRYDALPGARAAANASGLKGARFGDTPCSVVGGGDDTNLLLEGVSALQLAVSTLVAVNAWNYYRVTVDRDWLVNHGFPVLRDVADMLVSAARLQPNGDPNEAPQYTLPDLVGLDGTAPPADDNALTVAAAQLALRGATEAAYLLGYTARPAWIDVRDGLVVPIYTVPPASVPGIVKRDADSASADSATLLEPLLTLTPVLTNGAYVPASVLSNNLRFWASHASPNALPPTAPHDVALPLNVLILAQTQAQLAQQVAYQNATAEATNFEAALQSFLDAASDDAGWGNLAADGAPAIGAAPNDLSLSCALIFAMLQGLASVVITGGVSDSRFVYAPMGISIASSAVMPPDWARLRVRGLGRTRADYDVINQLLIPSNFSGGMFIPWSVNVLTF